MSVTKTFQPSSFSTPSPDAVPPAAKAGDALAWTGETRIYRVGDDLVAWIDMSKQELLDRSTLDVAASPEFFDGLDLLRTYILVTGTFPTKDTIVNGYRVGKFAQRQRTGYRNNTKPAAKDKLALDKIAVLENHVPYWHWDARLGRPLMHGLWFEHFTSMLTRPKDAYWNEESRFGYDWRIRQNDDYREGKMPLYRRALLEASPGWQWRTEERPYGQAPYLPAAELDPMALATDEPFTDLSASELASMIAGALAVLTGRAAQAA